MKSLDELSSLKVVLRNRRKILFEGKVNALSSVNDLGEFDILPEHANFVSLIKDKVVLDKGTSYEQIYDIDSGLLNVDEDGVKIYVGIGTSDKKSKEK